MLLNLLEFILTHFQKKKKKKKGFPLDFANDFGLEIIVHLFSALCLKFRDGFRKKKEKKEIE